MLTTPASLVQAPILHPPDTCNPFQLSPCRPSFQQPEGASPNRFDLTPQPLSGLPKLSVEGLHLLGGLLKSQTGLTSQFPASDFTSQPVCRPQWDASKFCCC